ncbi:flagellin-like hook-associated protein FlgL [Bradyrhizobium sp. LM3.4]
MSNIVLSASVRQNLLSLQSTADLLATTQERLSTGKKVNTALDNPTNFFTAQGLDNRATATSATCWMASTTVCRCSRRPIPASHRCRS